MADLLTREEAERRLASRGVRTLDMGLMTTQAPPPPDYLFDAWALTSSTYALLYAPGDTGKSYLMLTILLTLALAGADCGVYDPLHLRPRPQKGGWPVLYLTGEDKDSAIWHRVWNLTRSMGPAAYLTAQRNMVVKSTQGLPRREIITDPGFRLEIASVAVGCRCVGMDTLSRYHAADENSNSEMGGVIAAIESVPADTGAAMLVAHHCNKASQSDGSARSGLAIRGASCIRESARWALGMAKVTDDVCVLVEDKHNDGRGHDPIYIEWTSAGTLQRCEAPVDDARVASIAPRRRARTGGGSHGLY